MQSLDEYMSVDQIVNWGKANLNIIKLNSDMTDEDIRRVMRWIGMCSYDTIFVDGDKPRLGRIGIGLMLSVTLCQAISNQKPSFRITYIINQLLQNTGLR